MVDDVPADVQDVLTQLHEAAVESALEATAPDTNNDPGTGPNDDPGAEINDDPGTDPNDDPGAEINGDVDADANGDPGAEINGDVDADANGDTPETFAASVDTAQTVATNKLPPGELRSQFTHGYDRALAVVAADPAVAAEYVRAVDRRLVAATGRNGVVGGDTPTNHESAGTDGESDADEDL